MNVPYFDLRRAEEELRPELREAIDRVLARGYYVLGPEVDGFEGEFARYLGVRHVVGVANGLEALELMLRGAGIGPGDEVIVPSNTYIATWLAVTAAGALPVPVEPIRDTHNLDPDRVTRALTPKTRAIFAVHLYGQPADMDPLAEIARRHGLFLFEDAAQAHGARYKGRMAGTLGHGAGFSFYPTKNLGALGDGGAVATDDDELAARVRLLRHYGQRTKYVSDVIGGNSRLDELQAACLRVKLRHLDRLNARRRQMAGRLLSVLEGLDAVCPEVPGWADPVWHLFVVRVEHRRDVQDALAERGVGTSVHYPISPHLQGAYARLGYHAGDFPIAEKLAGTVLSLPMGPYFTDEEQAHVAAALKTVLGIRDRRRLAR